MPTKKQPESKPKAETPKVVIQQEELTPEIVVSKPNEPEENPTPKKIGSFKTRKGNTITFN